MRVKVNGSPSTPGNYICDVFLKLIEHGGEGDIYYVVEKVNGFSANNARIAKSDVFLYERNLGEFVKGDTLNRKYTFINARYCEEIVPENNKAAIVYLTRKY